MFISLIFFVWICENQVLIFQTFTLDVIEVKQTNKQTNKQAIITTYKEFLEICIESKNDTYIVCINQ